VSSPAPSFSGIVERALALVSPGMVVGLGTGHAATAFIEALGNRVQAGLQIRGVPTSQASASLAKKLGIQVVGLGAVDAIDVAVDGADEIDPQCNLIKGYGGALVREKIVASAARQFVILVGAEKLVGVLGAHGKLPVEVVPFALEVCRRRLGKLGLPSEPRTQDGSLFVTDNGNHILDCRIVPPGLSNPGEVELALRAIPGVVGTGLFLGMAHVVLIQEGERVVERQGPERA
jgi:ribose 5-phosphate isomerase A